MNTITIHDKQFSLFIPSEKIQQRVEELAAQINFDYKDEIPLFISVLNGAFLFTADLLKKITVDCQVSFVKLTSYQGTQSSGVVKNIIGLNEEIANRRIIILEDIVDSGNTAVHLLKEIEKHHPSEIKIASLLLKPTALKYDVKVDYLGFEVPDNFLVGYGLDYNGLGRNLNDIWTISME